MNTRKSLASLHQNSNNKISKIKLQMNSDDQRIINSASQNLNVDSELSQQYISNVPHQNGILNRLLLLQPPSMISNNKNQDQNKKLSIYGNGQNPNQKYKTTFFKPDVQTLIQQNVGLKTVIQTHNQTINSLRVKNNEYEKKFKVLQKAIEKYQHIQHSNQDLKRLQNQPEKRLFGNQQNNSNQYSKDIKAINQSNDRKSNDKFNGGGLNINSVILNTTGTMHIQILKKKNLDLTNMYMTAENQLKILRKLPSATIYQQNDIQKQHLMAQTVRLKAIIASLSSQIARQNEQKKIQNQGNIDGVDCSEEKFQNHFMRLMKEQNQKLKATIRLLQNDKILLKSRQTIMNKYNGDLKKEIDGLKQKISYKQAELEKLNNQNKNLLFKKTNQFKQQQQKKQSQVVQVLRNRISQLESSFKKVEELNEFYSQQNLNLKQKQKNLLQEISQIQLKYDRNSKSLYQQVEQLQFQLNSQKTDYLNALNSMGGLKNKKSILLMKGNSNNNIQQSKFNQASCQQNGNQQYESQQSRQVQQNLVSRTSTASNAANKMTNQSQNAAFSKRNKRQQIYFRRVKWQDIYLSTLHVYKVFKLNVQLRIQEVLHAFSDQRQSKQTCSNTVNCRNLIDLFTGQPFNIQRGQAQNLARYIVEDDSNERITKILPGTNNQKVLYSQQAEVNLSLAITILRSALNKIKQSDDSTFYQQKWKIILSAHNPKKLLQNLWTNFILNEQILILNRKKTMDENSKNYQKQLPLNMRQFILPKYTLFALINKHARTQIQEQDLDYLTVRFFDKERSQSSIYLKGVQLMKFFQNVSNLDGFTAKYINELHFNSIKK